jgi:acetyltransferase-like isoleucine patch superfamily enzyme
MSLLTSIGSVFELGTRYRKECTVSGWRRVLGGRLSIGQGAHLGRARLMARDPDQVFCSIGDGTTVRGLLVLERAGAVIRIGSRSQVGGRTLLDASERIEIGDDVLVSFDVLITDNDSHSLRFSERAGDVADWTEGRKDWTHVARAPVRVMDKAWIGARAILLKGVTVGEGAMVGAGSVVTRDVPPWHLAAGNPARVIRELPR